MEIYSAQLLKSSRQEWRCCSLLCNVAPKNSRGSAGPLFVLISIIILPSPCILVIPLSLINFILTIILHFLNILLKVLFDWLGILIYLVGFGWFLTYLFPGLLLPRRLWRSQPTGMICANCAAKVTQKKGKMKEVPKAEVPKFDLSSLDDVSFDGELTLREGAPGEDLVKLKVTVVLKAPPQVKKQA